MKNLFRGKHGVLLIAEIGGNHEGNFEYAVELTRKVIETDVDIVKFQLYTGDTLVNYIQSPERNAHFKKFELTKEQYCLLAEMVVNAGKMYSASVWDVGMIDWIDRYVSIYKIGSGDLTAYPIIEKIAERKKPIILSTGLSSEIEVCQAIRKIQEFNPMYTRPENLAILQCTSMYPVSMSDANLSVIRKFKESTGLTVGYSDHTEGLKALCYSVAFGAEILEFHFTDTRDGKVFRDHKVSLAPDEIQILIQEINLIKKLEGYPLKKPLKIEIDNKHEISFRRAVYPVRDIKKGTIVLEDDLICLRPCVGISANDYEFVIGKRAKSDIVKYQKLSFDLFE